MQEEKFTDSNYALIWVWQCDPDPYQRTGKSNWEKYPDAYCKILEKVFLSGQCTADLGDYYVDFTKMVQINKKDRNKVREVRRLVQEQSQSRFMTEMPKPEKADQRSMNLISGTGQRFLDFLLNRFHGWKEFHQSLQELSLDAKKGEFKEIIDGVIACIWKGAEEREKVIQKRYFSHPENHILRAEEIVAEIKAKSKTLRDFLKVILKTYTKESFVCYWLNELLRNNKWKQISIFMPYLVCLLYTFQNPNYTIKHEVGFLKKIAGLFQTIKLTLYRGTAMTEKQFADYQKKGRNFTWNCVTSTSRSREIALDFMLRSLDNDESQSKIGVLFVIEADFGSVEDCEGMIDVAEDSQFPHEEEVILAPGSMFQLEDCYETQDFYEVHLEVKKKFE